MSAGIFILAVLGGPLGFAILAAAVSLHLILQVALPELGMRHFALILAGSLSLPALGAAVAALLAEFLEWRRGPPTFLGALLAMWAGYDLSLDYFAAAMELINTLSVFKLSVFVVSLASALVACSALISLVLMLLVLIPELFVHWCVKAAPGTQVPFKSVRLLLMLALAALAFNLMLGLCATELNPTIILRKMAA